MMRILYLHGLHSKPGGTKPTFLGRQGHEVINPALPDDDFDRSLEIAQSAYEESRPDLIVGSSRGGAVALGLDAGSTPLVLIAPAWRKWGTVATVKPGTIILHSFFDGVIPIDDSRDLLHASGVPESSLVVVGDNHNMIDEAALGALVEVLSRAASRLSAASTQDRAGGPPIMS